MPKQIGKRNTTPAEHQAIVSMASSGISQAEMAKAFNITIRGVQKILQKYEGQGHVNDLPRTGRPSIINDRGL